MNLFALLAIGLLGVAAAQQATDVDDDTDADRDKRQSSQSYYGQQPRAAAPAPAGAAQLLTRFPSYGGADGGVSRNTVTASPRQQSPTRRPAPSVADNQREYQHQVPVYRPQPQPQQLQGKAPLPQRGQYPTRQQQQQLLEDEELEEEEQKPDRLTELLPQSKFDCHAKKTGYYADDGLACEVFHYCQDNAKHSWICPEGFQFHQVHLICMPPSTDNICAQSSDYHFVNDYLYRPINTEEHLQKPNISLKYADRYYPENYYEESHEPQPQRHVVQTVAPVQQQQQQRRPLPQPIQRVQQYAPQPTQRPQHFPAQRQQQQQQYAPQQLLRQQPNQVFHSSEEVNIPLQHRRPSAAAPPARTTNYQDRDDDEDEEEEEYEYEDPPYRQG